MKTATKKNMRDEYLLFLDLETTGVDPGGDLVLEVGCVLVEANTLENVWQQTDLIACSDGIEPLMNDFVKDMHTKSGLLANLKNNAIPRLYLEDTLCNYLSMIRNTLGAGYADIYASQWIRLAGYSPQFDRQFILRDAPRFSKLLSHRMMDVSSLRACAKSWAPNIVPEQESEHRALADCMAAIEELKVYRGVFQQVVSGSGSPV